MAGFSDSAACLWKDSDLMHYLPRSSKCPLIGLDCSMCAESFRGGDCSASLPVWSLRQVCDQGHLFKDSKAAGARRNAAGTLPRSLVMITPATGCRSYVGVDPCSLLQTQAAQVMLQNREAPAMPRMAYLLGLMGIGMSGYSSRQLTLHYKPSSHLFRWERWRKHKHVPTPANIYTNFIPNLHINLKLNLHPEI